MASKRKVKKSQVQGTRNQHKTETNQIKTTTTTTTKLMEENIIKTELENFFVELLFMNLKCFLTFINVPLISTISILVEFKYFRRLIIG